MNGKPYNMSTILIMVESILPPKKPATMPQETPMTNATAVATKPTKSETLAP